MLKGFQKVNGPCLPAMGDPDLLFDYRANVRSLTACAEKCKEERASCTAFDFANAHAGCYLYSAKGVKGSEEPSEEHECYLDVVSAIDDMELHYERINYDQGCNEGSMACSSLAPCFNILNKEDNFDDDLCTRENEVCGKFYSKRGMMLHGCVVKRMCDSQHDFVGV